MFILFGFQITIKSKRRYTLPGCHFDIQMRAHTFGGIRRIKVIDLTFKSQGKEITIWREAVIIVIDKDQAHTHFRQDTFHIL